MAVNYGTETILKRPSKNNRCQTRWLYTTNLKQYLQLTNFDKYDHTLDENTNYIIITNKKNKDSKGVFNHNELLNYLEMNSYQSYANTIRHYAAMKESICEWYTFIERRTALYFFISWDMLKKITSLMWIK